jgi:ribonuclease D
MEAAAAPHLEHDVVTLEGDLDEQTFRRLRAAPLLAWDIETTGLDWKLDEIRTVQMYDGGTVVLVTAPEKDPELLIRLVEDADVPKVMHHAMFDLRFMANAWKASAQNVACTKIAAKLLKIEHSRQSLRPLVQAYLGVLLDKSEQLSDWSAAHLSTKQLAYVAGDVWYLSALMSALREELQERGRWDLAEECFAHLPVRVQLEVQGFDDVFVY